MSVLRNRGVDRRLDFLSPEEAVTAARNDIYKGETTAAVGLLAGTFVEIFDELCAAMPDETVEDVLGHWPDMGVRMTLTDECVQPVYERDCFNAIEAVAYFRFVRRLIAGLKASEQSRGNGSFRQFFGPDFAWRASANVSALAGAVEKATRSAIRSVPEDINTKVQWFLISLLVEIGFGCAHISTTRLRIEESVRSISVHLSEPGRTARKILKNSHKWRGAVHVNDRRTHRTLRSLETMVNAFCWESESDYRSFAGNDSSSRIIASAHTGYARAASIRISMHSMPGSEVINIVQEKSGKSDFQTARAFYAARDIRFREIGVKDLDVTKLVSKLRKGRTIVHMMFDLSLFFGRTVTVSFLGQDAQFSRGPAELAVIGRAQVYPGFTCFDGERQRIKLSQPIPHMQGRAECRKDAVQRITQGMVKELENIIRVYPEQWQFVAEINKYFTGKGGAAIRL